MTESTAATIGSSPGVLAEEPATPPWVPPVAPPPTAQSTVAIPPFPWTIAITIVFLAYRTLSGLLTLGILLLAAVFWAFFDRGSSLAVSMISRSILWLVLVCASGVWGMLAIRDLWRPSVKGWWLAYTGLQILALQATLVGTFTPFLQDLSALPAHLEFAMRAPMVLAGLGSLLLAWGSCWCLQQPASLTWCGVDPGAPDRAWRRRWKLLALWVALCVADLWWLATTMRAGSMTG